MESAAFIDDILCYIRPKMSIFNPLTPELIYRHAGVDRLPAHGRGAHSYLKFKSEQHLRSVW